MREQPNRFIRCGRIERRRIAEPADHFGEPAAHCGSPEADGMAGDVTAVTMAESPVGILLSGRERHCMPLKSRKVSSATVKPCWSIHYPLHPNLLQKSLTHLTTARRASL